jgi:hypothetical protein
MQCQSIESSFDENRLTMPVAGIFVLVEGEKCCRIILKRKNGNTGYAAIDSYEITSKFVGFIIMNFNYF